MGEWADWCAMREGAAATQLTPQTDIRLSDIMRTERIINIHWDKHLDRFSVVLSDYSSAEGASVGDALAKVRKLAA